jgi:group I intron endonuclease
MNTTTNNPFGGEPLPKGPSVYCFYRKGTRDVLYDGESRNLLRRAREHERKLRQGKHRHELLQSIYNQHGNAGFDFEIVERCTVAELKPREKHWINQHNPQCNIQCMAKLNRPRMKKKIRSRPLPSKEFRQLIKSKYDMMRKALATRRAAA